MKFIYVLLLFTFTLFASQEYENALELLQKNPQQAIKVIQRLANNGNIDAQLDLYDFYNHGVYLKQDQKKATYWIQKAAQKSPKAKAILGARYIQEKNYKQGLKYLNLAAKKSDPLALYILGSIYYDGKIVKQSCSTSTKYHKRAVQSGSMESASYFFLAYKNGNKCIQKNKVQEKKWLLTAAKLESPLALKLVGYSQLFSKKENPYGLKKDIKKAQKNLLKAAELGDIDAAFRLGQEYESGYRLLKDIQFARKLYEFAANNGHILARYRLGTLYQEGLGVKKDLKKACDLFELATDYPGAAFNLASCYQNGKGRKKDLKKAHQYFLKAAEKNHLEAQTSCGMDYQYGRGTPIDMYKARYWYKRAITNSYRSTHDYGMEFNHQNKKWRNYAKLNLSTMLANGEGGTIDKAKSFQLMKEAALSGIPSAQNSLAVKYINGEGIAKNKDKAIYWFKKAAKQGDTMAIQNLKRLGLATF